jgi:hypothetical protein
LAWKAEKGGERERERERDEEKIVSSDEELIQHCFVLRVTEKSEGVHGSFFWRHGRLGRVFKRCRFLVSTAAV